MMFSSHIDMIYKNSALQDIFVNITEHKSKKEFPGLAWWILLFSVYFSVLTSRDDISFRHELGSANVKFDLLINSRTFEFDPHYFNGS